MEGIYRTNLEILKRRNFFIAEVLEGKNLSHGEFKVSIKDGGNLIVNDKKIYKSSNPRKTAVIRVKAALENEKILPHFLVIAAGFGLGYEIEELLKTRDVKNLVIVDDLQVFKEVVNHRDLSHVFSDKRIKNIYTSDELGSRRMFEDFYNMFLQRRYVVLDLRIPLLSSKALMNVYNVILWTQTYMLTTDILSRDFFRNVYRNFPKHVFLPGVNLLEKKFEIPALVISGGPSLDNDLKTIKIIKDRVLLIAISASLKPLLREGITPDFVAYVDPSSKQYEYYLKDIRIPKKTFVFLNPNVHWKFYDRKHKIFTSQTKSVGYSIKPFTWLSPYKGSVIAGESVAHVAFGLALSITSGPVILVGQDLAYPLKGKTHASGSGKDAYVEIRENEKRKYIWVRGNYSESVPTTPNFLVFRNTFSSIVKFIREFLNDKRELINATSGGAYIEGFEVAKLDSVRVKQLIPESKIGKYEILYDVYKSYSADDVNLRHIESICENYYSELEDIFQKLTNIDKVDIVALFDIFKNHVDIFNAILELSGIFGNFEGMFGNILKGRKSIGELDTFLKMNFYKMKRSLSTMKRGWRYSCKKILEFQEGFK